MSIKLIFASTAALALVAGTPAFAAKSQSQPIAATAADAGAKAKSGKTCRNFENSASRLKRQRLCLTREGWKKFDQQAQ